MAYKYDSHGWFIGESAQGRRTTPYPPKNPSVSDTPGELRANWTGRVWVDRQYIPHDEAAHQAALAADRETRSIERAARDPENIIKGLRVEVADLKLRVAALETKGP